MARIAGVDLPSDKRIDIALRYIYGIGASTARRVLAEAKVSPEIRVNRLSEQHIRAIREAIAPYRVEGDLRKEINANIKRLMDIGSYRGLRHRKGLPVRGQRTRTNARTRRGARKTVGVVRKESVKKMGGAAAVAKSEEKKS